MNNNNKIHNLSMRIVVIFLFNNISNSLSNHNSSQYNIPLLCIRIQFKILLLRKDMLINGGVFNLQAAILKGENF